MITVDSALSMDRPPARRRPDVALIGAGWAGGARHLPALRASRRCRVLGVVDRIGERARTLAKKFKLPYHATSLDAPWLDQVEAVTIAVAPTAHYELAHEMLSRGKHVLLEKPFTITVAEGEALAALARMNGRVLAVVHNFQFARSARAALSAVAAGRWGRVTGVHALQLSNPRRRLPTWCDELPLGLFYDESPHLFYLLRAFGGPLRAGHARIVPSSRGGATPALVQAQFDGECGPATLFMNFEAPVSEWHVLVFTERGLGIVDLFRDILHFVPGDGPHRELDIASSSWSLLRDHAAGFWRSGCARLTGRLDYGNNEVTRRFLGAVVNVAPLRGIGTDEALEVLRLQHEVLSQAAGRPPAEAVPPSLESVLGIGA